MLDKNTNKKTLFQFKIYLFHSDINFNITAGMNFKRELY